MQYPQTVCKNPWGNIGNLQNIQEFHCFNGFREDPLLEINLLEMNPGYFTPHLWKSFNAPDNIAETYVFFLPDAPFHFALVFRLLLYATLIALHVFHLSPRSAPGMWPPHPRRSPGTLRDSKTCMQCMNLMEDQWQSRKLQETCVRPFGNTSGQPIPCNKTQSIIMAFCNFETLQAS